MRRRLFTTAALVLLGAFSLRVPAEDLLPLPAIGKFRLPSGQYLDIGKPRRIGCVDRIDSISYRPGTHRIAAVGHRVEDGRYICTIHLIAGNSGQDDTLVSLSEDLPPLPDNATTGTGVRQADAEAALEADWDLWPSLYTPSGWNADGRYFITMVGSLDDASIKTVCIDALKDPATTREVALDGYTLIPRGWSPDRTRMAFDTMPAPNDAVTPVQPGDRTVLFTVYDPATERMTKIEKKGCWLDGWLNDHVLLLLVHRRQDGKPFLAHDLTTGTDTPLTAADVAAMRQSCPAPTSSSTPTGTSESSMHPLLAMRGNESRQPSTSHRDARRILRRFSGNSHAFSGISLASFQKKREEICPFRWQSCSTRPN